MSYYITLRLDAANPLVLITQIFGYQYNQHFGSIDAKTLLFLLLVIWKHFVRDMAEIVGYDATYSLVVIYLML